MRITCSWLIAARRQQGVNRSGFTQTPRGRPHSPADCTRRTWHSACQNRTCPLSRGTSTRHGCCCRRRLGTVVMCACVACTLGPFGSRLAGVAIKPPRVPDLSCSHAASNSQPYRLAVSAGKASAPLRQPAPQPVSGTLQSSEPRHPTRQSHTGWPLSKLQRPPFWHGRGHAVKGMWASVKGQRAARSRCWLGGSTRRAVQPRNAPGASVQRGPCSGLASGLAGLARAHSAARLRFQISKPQCKEKPPVYLRILSKQLGPGVGPGWV